MTDRASLLTLAGVRICVEGACLIERFDLDLQAGDSATVSGPPGSGKSLLLRVAAGLEPPAGGTVKISAPLRAFIFQSGGLISNTSVTDNLLLPLFYRGLSKAEALPRVQSALEYFGLDAVAKDRPGTLVGESRRLVQYARAMALDAQLLFIEEPFASLSRPSAVRAGEWLAGGLRAGKIAALMTATDTAALQGLAGRVFPLSGSGELGLFVDTLDEGLEEVTEEVVE